MKGILPFNIVEPDSVLNTKVFSILLNNSLLYGLIFARAFSIGTALTINSFRVKVGPKILASNLLFGVIVGFIAKKYFIVN